MTSIATNLIPEKTIVEGAPVTLKRLRDRTRPLARTVPSTEVALKSPEQLRAAAIERIAKTRFKVLGSERLATFLGVKARLLTALNTPAHGHDTFERTAHDIQRFRREHW